MFSWVRTESLAAFASWNKKFFWRKYIMRLNISALALIAATALATSMAAQTPPDSATVDVGPGTGLRPKAGMISMHVDDNMDVAPVKGAPFCATVTTEHTQLLADGNRIHTADDSMLCRDSEGRTRREAGLNLLGAAPQTSAPKLITIVDPVAGVRYLLDTDNKVAHKMPVSPAGFGAGGVTTAGLAGPAKGERVMVYGGADAAGPNVLYKQVFVNKAGQDSNESAPATENLGDQTIDGIHATGTRMTTTIPSGKMGNEKPIVVTSERWYSPELKATVMTKHNDPWAGELKIQFTNVNTSEPDASLFTVPSDYKVVHDKAGPFTIQMSAPSKRAQ
jgi:hypothetical protein